YRLRLCEGLHREIAFRQGTRDRELGTDDGVRFSVEDMLRLKNALPFPQSEEEMDGMEKAIREALAGCESEVARAIPVGSIAHHMRLAFQASQRPYRATLDEMVLL